MPMAGWAWGATSSVKIRKQEVLGQLKLRLTLGPREDMSVSRWPRQQL